MEREQEEKRRVFKAQKVFGREAPQVKRRPSKVTKHNEFSLSIERRLEDRRRFDNEANERNRRKEEERKQEEERKRLMEEEQIKLLRKQQEFKSSGIRYQQSGGISDIRRGIIQKNPFARQSTQQSSNPFKLRQTRY